MKTLSILFFLLSLNSFAGETIIVGASDNSPSGGFSDSSFSHNPDKKFCYIGSIQDVCDLIYKSAFDMQASYAGGDHDNIQIKKCEVKEVGGYWESVRNEIFVEVSYKLTDDYGGNIDVTKKIEECH